MLSPTLSVKEPLLKAVQRAIADFINKGLITIIINAL
jgi:hypothetical protein